MSKRIPVVRRKAAKTVAVRGGAKTQSKKSVAPNRGSATKKKAAAKKAPVKKKAPTATPKKSPAKKARTTAKATKSTSLGRAKKVNAAASPSKKVPARVRSPKTAGRAVTKVTVARAVSKVPQPAKPATPSKAVTHAAPPESQAIPTPRSITPVAETKTHPKPRTRVAARSAVRGTYVSPAQRVLEAQQAAQQRARRIQMQREEAAEKHAPVPNPPPSEAQSSAEASASSEMRASTAFVRRGRLSPREPGSSPVSEMGPLSASTPGSFDAEWRRIERLAHHNSIEFDREHVQAWLEPWLSGKDTLALIQSSTDSGMAHFFATQTLERKTLLLVRSSADANDIAQRFSRMGLETWTLGNSEGERKDNLNRFSSATCGTLVVPLSAFDDAEVASELQLVKVTGLVVEEAQRISELSFDFDVAYDRVPNIISRMGRPSTLAILRSAPPSVRTDLPHRLGLRNAQRVDIQPLSDTIALEVPVVDVPHRGGTLIERLGQAVHPVLILCAAPEEVDEVVEVLGSASLNFRMSAALSAVGMGHITPSVRGEGPAVMVGISGLASFRDPAPKTIIHYRAPSSLEQYARDLGRLAGGDDNSAWVLAATEDETQVRQWLERQRPRPEDLLQVAGLLSQHAGPGKMALVDTLLASSGIGRPRLEAMLSLLASAGWVEHKMDWVRIPETVLDLLDRARALAARLKALRERDHQRMRSVSAYVIGRNCRHESMRRHFGTAAQRPCGICDNCRTKAAHASANGSQPPSEPEPGHSVREPEVIFE